MLFVESLYFFQALLINNELSDRSFAPLRLCVRSFGVFFFFLILITAAICGCGNNQNASAILNYYTHDMKFVGSEENYFLPQAVWDNYRRTFRGFDQNAEYGRKILRILSCKGIRPEIREVCSIYFSAENFHIQVQFPDRKTYDTYCAKYKENPSVSKDDLVEFLKFEYAAEIIPRDSLIVITDNFIKTYENSTYKKKPLHHLSKDNAEYFLSDAFAIDMDVVSAWVRKKMWKDLNSVIIRKDERLFIYTFDPNNDLPAENEIKKVVLIDPESRVYMTRTGNYTFNKPDNAVIKESFENKDGSLDILYQDGNGETNGIRIFLTGSAVDIDEYRRIISPAQPVISANPASAMVFKGETPPALTVNASSPDGGTLSYRWYSNTTPSNSGGTLIPDADGASYTPSVTAAGSYYYYAVITNTNPKATTASTVTTGAAQVKVNAIPPPNATVTVNTGTKFQYVRGFGGIDSPWPGGAKALTLDNIETMFNPDKLGYNIMRIMVMPDNTNPDTTIASLVKAGGSGPNYVEGVKTVNKHGGYVLATPWSPPAAWKNNNAVNCEFAGTTDCADKKRSVKLLPENYQNYANYLKAFCNAMSDRGAPVYAVSIQNEPNGHVGYDGCIWTPEEMRDFFKQVGSFTTGTKGWGGGKAQPRVLAMNGESMHTVEINDAAMNDPASRAGIDMLGRHLYGYKMQGKMANLYGKEIWMSEYNMNENHNMRDEKNDYTWNYVWLFMNAVDLSIRLNNENAFIWWTSKRWYSLIGEGDFGSTADAVLPRGYGLSHYAKFAKETNRVDISVSGKTGDGTAITTDGTTANFNHGTYSEGPNVDIQGKSRPSYLNDYQRAVKVTAYEAPDGNSISLVMFTPTLVDGTKGVDMGTVKIQLPSGFKIAGAKAMRSTAEKIQPEDEDVIIGVDHNSAYVTLPASAILSVMFKRG